MAAHVMPIRGERGAPIFDQKRPNELGRYFDQLETLFNRCNIVGDIEKKKFAVSFVEYEVADAWEALDEYSSLIISYDDFKSRLMEIYNQVSLRYILADLDRLVGERQRIGIKNLQDLADFHLRFHAIASYLLTNQLISAREQSQVYIRMFDKTLSTRIMTRLQIKLPEHHPAMPYKINDICEAAKWVLQGIPPSFHGAEVLPTSTVATTIGHESGYVKTEQLNTLFSEFAKTIVSAMNTTNQRSQSSGTYNANLSTMPQNTRCNFDGCERFIRDCPKVEEYIQQGECRHNFEGKVVLPSGAFVPRDLPGQNLKDRIDEWHRRYSTIVPSSEAMLHAVVRDEPPHFRKDVQSKSSSTSTYQLSPRDRITALEAELFSLRTQHQSDFVPVIKTRRQHADEQTATKSKEVEEPKDTEITPRIEAIQDEDEVEEVRNEKATPVIVEPVEPEATTVEPTPEHPFRHAKDAIYVPPQSRNVGAPVKSNNIPNKRPEPAYRTLPAIHNANIASTVYQRALDTPLTITYHELLSLSPEVRSQIREATSTKRTIGPRDATQNHFLKESNLTEDELAYLMPGEILLQSNDAKTAPVDQYDQSQKHRLPGSIVLEDPIEKYYKSLGPDEEPDAEKINIAKESSALRSILPLVDNQLKVEAILDPGCQIVAMSEDVCHELGIAYDPKIVLNMQSANGTVDPSLGLARNVAFLIGHLTFYMQVHVIRNPAYDILLGRPFDVLTQSVVRNFSNEDQTITIHDPNSDQVATLPTIPRGHCRLHIRHKNAVFRK